MTKKLILIVIAVAVFVYARSNGRSVELDGDPVTHGAGLAADARRS